MVANSARQTFIICFGNIVWQWKYVALSCHALYSLTLSCQVSNWFSFFFFWIADTLSHISRQIQNLWKFLDTLYSVLCAKRTSKASEEMEYKELTEVLEEHFDPRCNEICRNYRLNAERNRKRASWVEFLGTLRCAWINCNFDKFRALFALRWSLIDVFVVIISFKINCWKESL